MTSQLVMCKISFNDYNSGTRGDVKQRFTPIYLDFDVLSQEKIKILCHLPFKLQVLNCYINYIHNFLPFDKPFYCTLLTEVLICKYKQIF